MKTVWVVEDGEYSDYRVVGVFTTLESARLVVDAITAGESYSRPTIAEWALDPAIEDLNAGRNQWLVYMLKNGDTERVERRNLSSYDLAGGIRIWKRSKAAAYKGTGVPDVLDATVWATDSQHAIKIVNEHRLQMIAAGKF